MSTTESSNRMTRRQLMTGAAALTGAAMVSGQSVARAESALSGGAITLSKGDTVLLQGDSITDGHRDRKNTGPNSHRSLGGGYANMIAAHLLGTNSHAGLQIYNRGVSGNKVPDITARWQADTVDLEPDILSILIGVNDFWHKLNGTYDGTVEDYATGFRTLLEQTRTELPKTKLVVCEPFALRSGTVGDRWYPEFDERRAAAREVAKNADALWVPFQSMFDEALTEETPPSYWAGDGVHPTMAGHALMARKWLDVTGLG